jgi:hypothetical protein
MQAVKVFHLGFDLPGNHRRVGSIGVYLYRTIWLRSIRVDVHTREVGRDD